MIDLLALIGARARALGGWHACPRCGSSVLTHDRHGTYCPMTAGGCAYGAAR